MDFGAREAYLPALEQGQLDLVPEFVGTLDTFLGGTSSNDLTADAQRRQAAGRGQGLHAHDAGAGGQRQHVRRHEGHGRQVRPEEGLRSRQSAPTPLKFGGPPECPTRPLCIAGLKSTYGLKFNV